MTEKYVLLDVDDPRTGKIAEVIGNKTSKKILGILAEGEMSATDLSNKLNLPLNTVWYNIEKLIDAGLIEEAKGFFWSVKGKKIKTYRVSNKKIVISPRSFVRGIVPTIVLVGIATLGIFLWENGQKAVTSFSNSYAQSAPETMDKALTGARGVASTATNIPAYVQSTGASNVWAWFLLGALTALVLFLIINLKKRGKI